MTRRDGNVLPFRIHLLKWVIGCTFDDGYVCRECKMRKEYKYESKTSYWVCRNIHGLGLLSGGRFLEKMYFTFEGKICLGKYKTVRFVVKKNWEEKALEY